VAYRDDDGLARRSALASSLSFARDPAERADLEREIALLDHVRRTEAKRRLPQIARARIATPCHERWDTMLGDGPVRNCSRCDQEVFDVALMTLAQAETMLRERNGNACMRLHVRTDGTMLFADCEIGAAGIRKRRLYVAAGAIALAGATATSMTAADAAVASPVRYDLMTDVRHGGVTFEPPEPDVFVTGLVTPTTGSNVLADLIRDGEPTPPPLTPRASRSRPRRRRPDRPDR